jgi:hypothetical protein
VAADTFVYSFDFNNDGDFIDPGEQSLIFVARRRCSTNGCDQRRLRPMPQPDVE